jgi:hypothetical protein
MTHRSQFGRLFERSERAEGAKSSEGSEVAEGAAHAREERGEAVRDHDEEVHLVPRILQVCVFNPTEI